MLILKRKEYSIKDLGKRLDKSFDRALIGKGKKVLDSIQKKKSIRRELEPLKNNNLGWMKAGNIESKKRELIDANALNRDALRNVAKSRTSKIKNIQKVKKLEEIRSEVPTEKITRLDKKIDRATRDLALSRVKNIKNLRELKNTNRQLNKVQNKVNKEQLRIDSDTRDINFPNFERYSFFSTREDQKDFSLKRNIKRGLDSAGDEIGAAIFKTKSHIKEGLSSKKNIKNLEQNRRTYIDSVLSDKKATRNLAKSKLAKSKNKKKLIELEGDYKKFKDEIVNPNYETALKYKYNNHYISGSGDPIQGKIDYENFKKGSRSYGNLTSGNEYSGTGFDNLKKLKNLETAEKNLIRSRAANISAQKKSRIAREGLEISQDALKNSISHQPRRTVKMRIAQ